MIMSMQPVPVLLKTRCVNCSLLIPRNHPQHSLERASTTMITILRYWITPTELSPENVLCTECMVILQDRAKTYIDGENMPLPAFGHRSICFSCGLSILRVSRTHAVRSDRQERNILLRRVPLHLVSRLERVCNACWLAAYREVRLQNQQNINRPILPEGGTSGESYIRAPPPLRQTAQHTPQHSWKPSPKLSDPSEANSNDTDLETSSDEADIDAMERCVNCGLTTQCNAHRRLQLSDEKILSVISQWKAPQPVNSSDYVCQACWDLAQRSSKGEQRQVGHRNICVRCGRSVASRINHLLHHGSIRESKIYYIIQRWIKPRTVEVSSRICHNCWVAADRAAARMARLGPSTSSQRNSNVRDLPVPSTKKLEVTNPNLLLYYGQTG